MGPDCSINSIEEISGEIPNHFPLFSDPLNSFQINQWNISKTFMRLQKARTEFFIFFISKYNILQSGTIQRVRMEKVSVITNKVYICETRSGRGIGTK